MFGKNTAENIMKGKGWNCVARAHKLAFEALWIILWPTFIQWMNDNNHAIGNTCFELANAALEHMRCGEIEAVAAAMKILW